MSTSHSRRQCSSVSLHIQVKFVCSFSIFDFHIDYFDRDLAQKISQLIGQMYDVWGRHAVHHPFDNNVYKLQQMLRMAQIDF